MHLPHVILITHPIASCNTLLSTGLRMDHAHYILCPKILYIVVVHACNKCKIILNPIGTLPKPHIPSRDPMFTGRDDEIKEITNLITDESTRLLNIWGSPGFGKTSTAVEVAHHLDMSLGYRVYFFKLQYVNTVDRFLSKILSIFQSKVDPTITHLDKLVSIFREISCPFILMFDNLDDLLTRETSSSELTNLFDELLDSNVSIKILFTTRELLKTTRGQVKGFKEIRIRPLSSTSSVAFVCQLLPSFSEGVVAKVVEISFLVPLAMKILASSLAENSEDIANKMLDEFDFSENRLEQIDILADEEKMQSIFESLFDRLKLNEKQALIYLTAFASALISKDAAIEIISGEMESTLKAVQSLNTLVKKTFIDKDVNTEYYSVHPLIYSFLMDKAKQRDFENVLNSSQIRFCRYYLLLFERLNDDFLAGKSVDGPQMQDAMQHLSTAMFQSTTIGSENSNDLFRILSKSEIFLFLICLPHSASFEIHKLYDLAIGKSKTLNSDSFLKLHVSKYFRNIAFSIFGKEVHVDIPESVRENIDLLSDGTPAKLSCYEAVFDISRGHINSGIQRVEMCVASLQKCVDHLLLKCLCLQILAVYYIGLNQEDKSRKFRELAFDVCAEIGNFNLFLIGDCDRKNDDVGESLFLFHYLFAEWSKGFLPAEIERYVCKFVYDLQQQKEVEKCYSPDYFNPIICYADYLVASLGIKAGQEVILNEKIECLNKSVTGYQDFVDATDNVFSSISQRNVSMAAYSTQRLLFCQDLKIAFTDEKEQNIEACHSALDHSLQHYGEQHQRTAKCYYNVGSAEYNLENYNAALSAFNQALKIMLNVSDEPDDFHFLNDLYLKKGDTCERLDEFEQAFSCYEEALNFHKTNNNEESKEFAAILLSMGSLQQRRMDFTSALATFKLALRIRINLFREKRCSYRDLVVNYHVVGFLYKYLGNDPESKKCFESALEILKISTDGEYESKEYLIETCFDYLQCLHWKVDENLCKELVDRCLPVIKENAKWLLPYLYLTVGYNQLESGKKEDGLAFIQNVLDLDLDDIQRAHADIRAITVMHHNKSAVALIQIGEYELANKIIEKALQVGESMTGADKPDIILHCYFLRGLIHIIEQEYASAIKSFQHALEQHSQVSSGRFDKLMEFRIRRNIATAHYYQRTYKNALNELLSIIKDCLVEGSENEAETYLFVAKVAQKMKIKSLFLRNLQLAYNTYLKVLGEDHPKTRKYNTAFVTACMHC